MTTYGPDPSGMKVWVTSTGKEPGPAEVLTEGKVNTEWIVEEGSYKHHLQPHTYKYWYIQFPWLRSSGRITGSLIRVSNATIMVSSRAGISSESSARLPFFGRIHPCWTPSDLSLRGPKACPEPFLKCWSPAISAPGAGFVEDSFPTDKRWGMVSGWCKHSRVLAPMRIQCCHWSDRRQSSGSNASNGEWL